MENCKYCSFGATAAFDAEMLAKLTKKYQKRKDFRHVPLKDIVERNLKAKTNSDVVRVSASNVVLAYFFFPPMLIRYAYKKFFQKNKIYENGKKKLDAYKKGAAAGCGDCMLMLADAHATGRFTAISPKKAKDYLQKAVAAGAESNPRFAEIKNNVTNVDYINRAYKEMVKLEKQQKRKNAALTALAITAVTVAVVSGATSDSSYATTTEGTVSSRDTWAGQKEYTFHDKENPTGQGERLKNFDPNSGTGETESGDKITKKQ